MVRSIKKQQSKLRVCSEKKLKSRSRKSSKRVSTLNNVSSRKKKQMGGRLKNFKVVTGRMLTFFNEENESESITNKEFPLPIKKQFREGTYDSYGSFGSFVSSKRKDSKDYYFKFAFAHIGGMVEIYLLSRKDDTKQMKKIESRNESDIKTLLKEKLGIDGTEENYQESYQELLKQFKICLKMSNLGFSDETAFLWNYNGENIKEVSIPYQEIVDKEINYKFKFVFVPTLKNDSLSIYLVSEKDNNSIAQEEKRYQAKKIEPRDEGQIIELLKNDLDIDLNSHQALLGQLKSCLNIVSSGILKNLQNPISKDSWDKFPEDPVTISVSPEYILKDSNLVEDSNLGENKDFEFKIVPYESPDYKALCLVNKQENFYRAAIILSGDNEESFLENWNKVKEVPRNPDHPIQKINELIGVDLHEVTSDLTKQNLKKQLFQFVYPVQLWDNVFIDLKSVNTIPQEIKVKFKIPDDVLDGTAVVRKSEVGENRYLLGRLFNYSEDLEQKLKKESGYPNPEIKGPKESKESYYIDPDTKTPKELKKSFYYIDHGYSPKKKIYYFLEKKNDLGEDGNPQILLYKDADGQTITEAMKDFLALKGS